ncbi:MAG: hypothetical protein ACI85I_000748 [Arenicella sp.]|jgi:hypothetical protein
MLTLESEEDAGTGSDGIGYRSHPNLCRTMEISL